MYRQAIAGLLVTVLVLPCAFADEDKKSHDMSPEAKVLDVDPVEKGWFGPEAKYDDKPYNAQEQLDIYGAKHMNKTAVPPVELGVRLYDRGAYTPRPTWLGETNPVMFSLMSYGDLRVAAADYDNGVPATRRSP